MTLDGDVAVAPLVGRDDELTRLVSVALAPPSVVLMEGEAGIGKTRLVTELRAHPAATGRRFLVGGARAIREPFPLGATLEALRHVAEELPPAGLSPVSGALRSLLPELAEALPPAPDPLDDRIAERHRVFRGLRELLAALCPATLVLEDLHWADRQTMELIHHLAHDLPDGLSVVLTFRGEEAESGLPELVGRLPHGVGRAHLTLAPLDAERTGELAAAVADTDQVSPEFAGYLCERTGGLPFAVEEVMALLRERGEVPPVHAARRPRALTKLAVPAAVRDHILARVALLPVETQAVLDTVAVLDEPAPVPLVGAVAAQPVGKITTRLSPAIRSGLLVDRHGQVGFRHALAAQAVYGEIPGPERRRIHEHAAQTLQQQHPDQPGRIAHHLRAAGRLSEWTAAAEQAADHAASLGHEDEAAELLEEVLRHGRPAAGNYGRLAAKLGRATMGTLHPPEVADLLTTALDHDLPQPVRAEIQLLLGALIDNADITGSIPRAFFHAAADNAAERTDVRAWALVAEVMRGPPDATYQELRRSISEALELVPEVGDRDFEVFLLGKIGLVLTLLGDPQWREVTARVETGAADAGWSRGRVNAYEAIGHSLCFIGDYEKSEHLLTGAVEGAVACRNRRLEAYTRSGLVLLDFCRGAWDRLPAAIESLTRELAERTPNRRRVDVVAGNLALARGDLETAGRLLSGVMTRLVDEEGSDMLPMAVGPLLRLALTQDDLAAADAVLRSYFASQDPLPLWPAGFRCLPDLVEALVAIGATDRAASLVSQYGIELSDRDVPLALAASRHAHGVLAAAAGRHAEAGELLCDAGARYETLRCLYEAARARERAADVLVEGGYAEKTGEPLRAALGTYEELGARWDVGRAARLARRCGVPVPAPHRSGPRGYGPALSPREREVAELAATGRTNQEIAAELFVTAETVKTHLRSVMNKLGVRSRAAIANHLPRR